MHICIYVDSFEIASYWSNCEMLKVCALTWRFNVTVIEKFVKTFFSLRISEDIQN